MKLLNKFVILCVFNLALSVQVVHAQEEKKDLPIDAGLVVGLYDLIEKIYVDEVDKKKVYISAIKGMLSGLDPHSEFLEPKEQKNLEEHSNGTFGGIGIVINKKDDFIEIVSPIDDTPGYRAGLKSSDTIIKIDDTLIRKMSLEDAVDLMRGTPGTTVVLTISRKDTSPFEVNIVRDIITVISAKGYLLEKDVGYLRVSSFQAPTAKLALETLEQLKEENEGDLKSIILDLRNNPGGLITSSIAISDLFIDGRELVVYTKGRSKEENIEYFSKDGDETGGAKVVVLVNKGSASASEIVAGALQDHKRAVIVGTKTFGKGSVQQVIPLKGGYGIKLTIARYYTPDGRSIQAKGIEPDVVLDDLKVSEKDKPLVNIRENDLENHIESSDDKKQTTINAQADADAKTLEEDSNISDEDKQKQESIDNLKKDYFVIQAMNILKALNLKLN